MAQTTGNASAFTCDLATCEFTTDRNAAHLMHHIRNRITTHLTPADILLMPKRADFQNPALVSRVDAMIKEKEPLWFMPHGVFDTSVEGEKRSWSYQLNMVGILPDSSRTIVKVGGIPVQYGIALPKDMKKTEFRNLIIGMLNESGLRVNVKRTDQWVKLYKMRGFTKERSDWLLLEFTILKHRSAFIKIIRSHNAERRRSGLPEWDTCEDDSTNFFALVARKYGFRTAGWNYIKKYTITPGGHNVKYTVHIDIADIEPVPAGTITALVDARDEWGDAINRGRVMEAMWDIETYRRLMTSDPPKNTDRDYTIFNLATAYSWHSDMATSMIVGFVDVRVRVRRDRGLVVFICGTERKTLETWIHVHRRMNPDIVAAFNGGNFDWPITREKMLRYHILSKLNSALSADARDTETVPDADVYKYRFQGAKIKIDAENEHEMQAVAQFGGMIDVDVLPTMLKLFPRSEVPKLASLNFFLAKMRLPSKEDMPYTRMFRIYERAAMFSGVPGCHCLVDGETGEPVPPEPIEVRVTMGEDQFTRECDCANHVRELDYVPDPSPAPGDNEYTDELHPEIEPHLCCHCSKYERNLDDMGDVVYYCAVDCIRPHELFVKRLIVVDKRELSTLSYTSLYDSYYRADGMKVRNLIGNCAHKFGIAFSNQAPDVSESDRTHYPGAWVGLPERKLNREDPTSGVDFSSLYPSLMMCYNISVDMLVTDPVQAEQLRKEGYDLHHIPKFTYERGAKKGAAANRKFTTEGWTVRHRGILEPGKDTRIVTHYRRKAVYTMPDGEKITAYDDEEERPRPGTLRPTTEPPLLAADPTPAGPYESVSYSYEPQYGRDVLPGERMGILPYVVRQLFERRKPVKARYLHYFELIEKMKKEGITQIFCSIAGEVISIEECEDKMNYVDALQKAIKVLSNTFYGESGNYRSPVFAVQCAAGTTIAGVRNINYVRVMVQRLGCHLHYGDTDSLYLSPPRRLFRDLRDNYELALAKASAAFPGVPNDPRAVPGTPAGDYKAARTAARLVYWEAKVRRTMVYMNQLTAEISLYLCHDNGTTFLNMAYEEVGLPTLFLGMKKYIMAAHMKTINFYPDSYMVRGVEYIKQGQTEFAATINPKMVRDIMIPDNELDPIDIVSDLVRTYPFDRIPADKLSLKAKYKPNKKNVPVHTFIDRMRIMLERYRDDPRRASLFTIPAAGDKFTFIIAKREIGYDIKGRKIDPKKGDKMEFLRVYNALRDEEGFSIELDIDWYVKSAFIGVFARFISYEERFQPPAGKYDCTVREDYKSADEAAFDAAQTYLTELYDNRVGFVKGAAAAVGREYQATYRRINKAVRETAATRYGAPAVLYHDIIEKPLEKSLGKTLCEMAIENDPPHADGNLIAAALIEAAGGDPFRTWTYYARPSGDTVYAAKYAIIRNRMNVLEREIQSLAPKITTSTKVTSAIMGEVVNRSRIDGSGTTDEELIDQICNAADVESMKKMYTLWCELRALEGVRLTMNEVCRAVMVAKAGRDAAPPAEIKEKGPRAFARGEARLMAKTAIPDYEWA